MSGDYELDKQTSAAPATPPRMLGESDVRVIMQFARKLQPDANILEIGPWLGGLTVLLAEFGRVTVLDRFIWSEANAENYPGIAAPEESFRPAFDAHMQSAGLVVDVVETTLPEFEWTGGALDFVFIDAPRDAALLHACFRAIATSLKPGACILIKHALNEQNFGMGAYLDALAGLGLVRIEASEQPDWCNIAAVTVVGSMPELADIGDVEELIASAPVTDGFTDPWYGHRLTLFRLAYLATRERWSDAAALLSAMSPSPENQTIWDALEQHLWQADTSNSDATLAARGLDMAQAYVVFGDVHLTFPDMRFDYGEERFLTFGWLNDRMIVLAWTPRAKTRRIISMRKANDRERQRYGARLDRS